MTLSTGSGADSWSGGTHTEPDINAICNDLRTAAEAAKRRCFGLLPPESDKVQALHELIQYGSSIYEYRALDNGERKRLGDALTEAERVLAKTDGVRF